MTTYNSNIEVGNLFAIENKKGTFFHEVKSSAVDKEFGALYFEVLITPPTGLEFTKFLSSDAIDNLFTNNSATILF